MSLLENISLVKRMTEEVWNAKNTKAFDKFYSATYVGHDPNGLANLQELKQAAAAYLSGFPGLHITTVNVFAEEDKVLKMWTARLPHTGDYMGIAATGNELVVSGAEIFRIANGKIEEAWGNMDTLGMLQQLGAIPSPGLSDG